MGRKGIIMTGLQRSCFYIAVADILFYFSTIVACVVFENVVSNKRPFRFIVQETGVTIVQPVQLPYGKDDLTAIWDYLATEHYDSQWVYNGVYMLLLSILVGYLILEIWLCCALIIGATQRSLGHCKRWLYWRLAVVLCTIAIGGSDLYQMQFTITLLLWTPLTCFRIATLMIVNKFIKQIRHHNKEII